MSVLCPAPLQNTSARPPSTPDAVAFQYTQTESFAPLLRELRGSLLVSTYQANKLLVVRSNGGGLSTLVRTFERPMGMAVDSRRLTLATRNAIWVMRNAPDLAPRLEPVGAHDACYMPRSCHLTGDIGVHEIAWAGTRGQESGVRNQGSGVNHEHRLPTPDSWPLTPDELWVVNTRFSCLCTLHPDYSFVPRWRPPFITALAAEDRCHLN